VPEPQDFLKDIKAVGEQVYAFQSLFDSRPLVSSTSSIGRVTKATWLVFSCFSADPPPPLPKRIRMKLFPALIVLVALGVAWTAFAAPSQLAPLPANVQTALETALKGVDPTNSDAVKQVVMGAIKENSSLAPGIVAFSVNFIGQALLNNPGAAEIVIPDFVLAAAGKEKALMTQIIEAAVAAVPTKLKIPVVPKIVSEIVKNIQDRKLQAEALNAAYRATGDNPDVITALDEISKEYDGIEIVQSDGLSKDSDPDIRYFVPESSVPLPPFFGDQGTINQGAGGFGGSGGGSGGPTPTPTPTPQPTPVS
jgi:hypothetical protein